MIATVFKMRRFILSIIILAVTVFGKTYTQCKDSCSVDKEYCIDRNEDNCVGKYYLCMQPCFQIPGLISVASMANEKNPCKNIEAFCVAVGKFTPTQCEKVFIDCPTISYNMNKSICGKFVLNLEQKGISDSELQLYLIDCLVKKGWGLI